MTNISLEERTNYEDVKYWLWSSVKQVERLRQSFDAQLNAIKSFNPSDGYTLEHQRINAQTSSDMHFLLIAVCNLVKATSKRLLPDAVKSNRLETSMAEKVEHLRNIHEHWEKTRITFSRQLLKNKSAKWYENNYPDNTPWSMSYDANGFVVCGILNVDELESALDKLNTALAE